jgi:glycine reductase
MRLQLDILKIKDVQFADQTTISDRVLYINCQELQEYIKEDKRLSHVEIELAHPGEKCRIIQVTDVVEPRAKKNGGIDFPGALGKHGGVGQGTTLVLRGTAVVLSECLRRGDPPMEPSAPQYGGLIDMSGPGAECGIYGRTHHIILMPWPANGVSLHDYRIALEIAGLRAAVYLAQAGRNIEPDEIEVYDLPPLSMISKELETLPKVAYIFQFLSGQFESIPGYPILYGSGAERIAPTILHPNEVLDGAIVTPYRSMGMEVFGLQNHSIIKELYRRHGKDLCFRGVVIMVAHDKEQENERAATMAAHLVKWILGADGVILTKSGGGIPEVAMALTAQRCEELGVKTSLALVHYPTVLSGGDSITLFNIPEVDAIVSLGTPHALITLPPVGRIIGKPADLPGGSLAGGEIKTSLQTVRGIISQIGNSRFMAIQN